jgi:hypothetical protein
MGNAVDFLHMLWHLIVEDAPIARLAMIVSDKKWGVGEASVVLPLGIDLAIDSDVIGLAFHNNQRGFFISLILGGTPYDEISSCLR